MNRKLIRSLMLILVLAGCSNLSTGDQLLDEMIIPTGKLKNIHVEISDGELLLEKSDNSDLKVLHYSDPEISSVIDQNLDTIFLDFGRGKIQHKAVINLPEDMNINITSFNADIYLNGLSAEADIISSAGNISLQNFQGHARLRAGRGDIYIEGGSGDLVLIGEHGLLSIKDFQGPISATTIMGEITFIAAENPEGDIHLESDHAPVIAILPEISNYQAMINSSGGIVLCSGNFISRTPTGCTGTTGESENLFEIRTVSGRIDFKILP